MRVPELPEVETVVRDLRPHLVGRRIVAVSAGKKRLRRPWTRRWQTALCGRRIEVVQRRGKWILLLLDDGSCLLVHLGMTGSLRVWPAVAPRAEHTHLIFVLDGGAELRFRDVRRFGSATWFSTRELLDQFFAEAELGPEPFDLDADYWRSRLERTVRSLKAILLDQRAVAGIGNIYADEALHEAKLHPMRSGRSMERMEVERLRRAIPTVLERAIRKRGSTIRDYVDGSGQKGRYQTEFRVYGRTGQPCLRCATPIERIRLAGRSTHFCSRCQPLHPNGNKHR